MNVTIGKKDIYDEWKLRLNQVSISTPQMITGTSSAVDLGDQFETVKYRERTMTLTFDTSECQVSWSELLVQINAYLQQKKMKIILPDDIGYYYYGSLVVGNASNESLKRLIITGSVEPYKYEKISSTQKWEWDSFHFEKGVIRYYKNLIVSGKLDLMIPGSPKKVVPVIFTDKDLQVEHNGTKYPIKAGMNKLYNIWMDAGENHLIFHGNGIVSVDFRGRHL